MRKLQLFTHVMLAAAAAGGAVYGQAVISAKAGVIHYLEGDVTLTSDQVTKQIQARVGGRFTSMKEGDVLATADGRAEVLLSPGSFLRMGENAQIGLVSAKLSDTRVEIKEGVALIEVTEGVKDSPLTVLVKDAAITFTKMCLVRVDAASGVRVYRGEAQVMADGTPKILKDGREFTFGTTTVAKFDTKVGDSLYRWANKRAEYIAMANIASANSTRGVYDGSQYPMYGGWYYNAFYGMMTYIPGTGMYRSPWGFMYFSPGQIYRYFERYETPVAPVNSAVAGGGGMGGRSWNSDNGYYTTQSRSAGVSVPTSSMGGGAPAATAPAAPPARGADVGTARGGGSGSSGQ